jgi:hypothetical protein
MDESGESLILYAPSHGSKEFFLLENRQNGKYYDSSLPDYGIAIWHIIEDPTIYANLAAPVGVDQEKWKTVHSHEWGRRGIRMIRPVYGPPFNNNKALWNGSDPETGYDVSLKWADGSYSGFSIKNISSSGKEMTFWIDSPN